MHAVCERGNGLLWKLREYEERQPKLRIMRAFRA